MDFRKCAPIGIDASRLIVGGDSAGGNLAAVVAIHAREEGPELAGQVLIYPATDFAMTHPSHSEPETSALLTHTVIRWFRDHYLGASDGQHWKASPARAEKFAGLPPAFVLTAARIPCAMRAMSMPSVSAKPACRLRTGHIRAVPRFHHHGKAAAEGQHRAPRHRRLVEGASVALERHPEVRALASLEG